MGDVVRRVVGSMGIALAVGCGGATPATQTHAETSTASTPVMWVVDHVADGSALVLDPLFASSARALADDDDWDGYERVEPDPTAPPVTEVRVLGAAPCTARVAGVARVEHMGAPRPVEDGEPGADADEPPSYVDLVVARVALLEGSCAGVIAVPVEADARFVTAPDFDYGDETRQRGRHEVVLDDGMRIVEERGEPLDEICPDRPLYTWLVGDRAVATLDGEARFFGVLVVGTSRWLVFDQGAERTALEAGTGRRVDVQLPSTTSVDWGASPCP